MRWIPKNRPIADIELFGSVAVSNDPEKSRSLFLGTRRHKNGRKAWREAPKVGGEVRTNLVVGRSLDHTPIQDNWKANALEQACGGNNGRNRWGGCQCQKHAVIRLV